MLSDTQLTCTGITASFRGCRERLEMKIEERRLTVKRVSLRKARRGPLKK